MSALTMRFERGAIHFPHLGLWLDAHEARTGPERVFVSHAHSDHTGAHREVILSAPTACLMEARIGGERIEHVLPFGERRGFNGGTVPYELMLLPAGHIFGSAMARVEAGGRSLLYTGDFKLRSSFSAELCEPCPADILVMETTFGRPHYRFPPTADVMRGVIRFCREALDNDESAVLFGYSLGKSQELLHGLGQAGLPIMLHQAVHKLTRVYEQFGQAFPPYEKYDPETARGKVLICPPHLAGSAGLRKLGKARTAILTGWAVDPSCRFQSQADAAFPLSDHADFPELIEMVKRVNPKKVYTLHGFAADFAHTLRELGFDAQALGADEQLTLGLALADYGHDGAALARLRAPSCSTTREPASSVPNVPCKKITSRLNDASSFLAFARACAVIAETSSKLEKTRLLADYLRRLAPEDVSPVATWFTRLPFAVSENKVLQLGWALLRDTLSAAGRLTPAEFHQVYLKHSDAGETAQEILQDHLPRPPALTLAAVAGLFEDLAAPHGPAAKHPLLLTALGQSSALEAKFLVKILTSDLRIGLKEGLVEEAIARAFEATPEEVRQANLLLGNIGETARLASRHQLAQASLAPFRPVKLMLTSPEVTAEDVGNRMDGGADVVRGAWCVTGEQKRGANAPLARTTHHALRAAPAPLWLEEKYDGIRCQLHKVGVRIALYSPDLKDITRLFPELVKAAQRLPADVILDGEIVGMNDEAALPFAELQKRLGRREVDLFPREEITIHFVAFDLLWRNGETLLNHPLAERRRALEALAPLPAPFRLSLLTLADSVEAPQQRVGDAVPARRADQGR